ncbi:unnamed protein product, partial [marine sediment metagenome]
MNPYLTEEKEPTQVLLDTLDYLGITIDEFKKMSDNQVKQVVERSSDV